MENSKFYDISKRFNTSKPTLKVDDEHIYTINTEKAVFLKIQEMQKVSDKNFDQKMLELTLGKEKADELNKLLEKLPNYVANFQSVIIAIMASIENVAYEVVEKRFQENTRK